MRWEVVNVPFFYLVPYAGGMELPTIRVEYSETVVIFTNRDGRQWAKNARDLSVSDLVSGVE